MTVDMVLMIIQSMHEVVKVILVEVAVIIIEA